MSDDKTPDIMGDAVPASRAEITAHINRLVGEKVMGWKVEQDPARDLTPQFVIEEAYRMPIGRWRPTDDIEQALAVMHVVRLGGLPTEAFAPTIPVVKGYLLTPVDQGRWMAGWLIEHAGHSDTWWARAVADEPGQAICLSALMCVGIYDQDDGLHASVEEMHATPGGIIIP